MSENRSDKAMATRKNLLGDLLTTIDHAADLARTLELIRAVRVRYEVGKAGQNALLRLEVLRDRLQDDLGDFVRAERRLSAGLARSLARPPASHFATPTAVESAPHAHHPNLLASSRHAIRLNRHEHHPEFVRAPTEAFMPEGYVGQRFGGLNFQCALRR